MPSCCLIFTKLGLGPPALGARLARCAPSLAGSARSPGRSLAVPHGPDGHAARERSFTDRLGRAPWVALAVARVPESASLRSRRPRHFARSGRVRSLASGAPLARLAPSLACNYSSWRCCFLFIKIAFASARFGRSARSLRVLARSLRGRRSLAPRPALAGSALSGTLACFLSGSERLG